MLYEKTILHNTNVFTFKICSELDDPYDNEYIYLFANKNIRSLGFREVRITIYNCDDFCWTCNGPTSSDCTSCYETFILVGNSCKCDDTYYFDSADSTYSD